MQRLQSTKCHLLKSTMPHPSFHNPRPLHTSTLSQTYLYHLQSITTQLCLLLAAGQPNPCEALATSCRAACSSSTHSGSAFRNGHQALGRLPTFATHTSATACTTQNTALSLKTLPFRMLPGLQPYGKTEQERICVDSRLNAWKVPSARFPVFAKAGSF